LVATAISFFALVVDKYKILKRFSLQSSVICGGEKDPAKTVIAGLS
jgi:hypothetical protein